MGLVSTSRHCMLCPSHTSTVVSGVIGAGGSEARTWEGLAGLPRAPVGVTGAWVAAVRAAGGVTICSPRHSSAAEALAMPLRVHVCAYMCGTFL